MQTNNFSNNLSMNEFVYKKIYFEFRKHYIIYVFFVFDIKGKYNIEP